MGGILGILLIFLLVYFLLTRNKKKQVAKEPEPAPKQEEEEDVAFPGIPYEFVEKDVNFTDINTGMKYSAFFKGELVVGPGQDADIVLIGDQTVSRKHCKILFYDKTVFVRLSSIPSPTRVNGILIFNDTHIRSGDVLKLGNTELKIEIKDRK